MAVTLKEIERELNTSKQPERCRYYFYLARDYAHVDIKKSMKFIDEGLTVFGKVSGKELPIEFCNAYIAGLYRIRKYNYQTLGNSTAANRAGAKSEKIFSEMQDIPFRAHVESLIHYAERRLNLHDNAINTLQKTSRMLHKLSPAELRNSVLYSHHAMGAGQSMEYAECYRLGEVHSRLGDVYSDVYAVNAATHNLLLAEKYLKQIPYDDAVIARVLNLIRLTSVCLNNRLLKRASRLIEVSLNLCKRANDSALLLYVQTRQCLLLIREQNYPDAKATIDEFIPKAFKRGMIDICIVQLISLTELMLDKAYQKPAILYIKKIEKLIGDSFYPGHRADLARLKSRLAFLQDNMQLALGQGRQSLKFALKDNSLLRESKAHKHLSKVFEVADQPAKALEHFKLHHTQLFEMHRHADRQIVNNLFDQFEDEGINSIQEPVDEVQVGRLKPQAAPTAITQRGKFVLGDQDDLHESINVIRADKDLDSDTRWNNFNHDFVRVKPHFYRRLSNICSSLTPTELRVCALTSVLTHTDDVAEMMGVSSSSILKYRWRIRRKLELERSVNLTYYLAGI